MKIKIEGAEMRIDVMDLVHALDDATRAELAKFLVADEYLFRAVLACVGKGDGYYFNEDEDGGWWFSSTTVLKLREALLPLMPEIARGAVTEALAQRNQAQIEARRHSEWAWKMYHAWCSRGREAFPIGPPPDIAPWMPAEIAQPSEIDSLIRGGT